MKASGLISRAFLAVLLSTPALAAAQKTEAPQVDTSGVGAACVAPGDESRPLSAMSTAERHALIECANRYAAQQINAQTPMRVDDITTLESVTTSGTTVIYNQRANVDVRDITAPIRAQMDQTVRRNVCASEQMRNTISYGGGYRYIWVDRAGAFIHRVDITRC